LLRHPRLRVCSSVANSFHPGVLRAMSATLDDAACLHAMSNYSALAMRTPWREGVYRAFEAVKCHGLRSAASGLFPASRPSRFVGVQIYAVHPFRYEALVLMADKNFWGVTVHTVVFRQFYCSTERLALLGKVAVTRRWAFLISHAPLWFITTYRDLCNFFLQLMCFHFIRRQRAGTPAVLTLLNGWCVNIWKVGARALSPPPTGAGHFWSGTQNPGRGVAVVLETRCAFRARPWSRSLPSVLCCSLLFFVVLCCSLLFFVVLCCSLDFLQRHRDIFFAGIEEPADTNDERADFARLVNENVHDLANLGIVRIIDVLFVPIGRDLRAAWYRRLQYL
jgi:hypothetical protein